MKIQKKKKRQQKEREEKNMEKRQKRKTKIIKKEMRDYQPNKQDPKGDENNQGNAI